MPLVLVTLAVFFTLILSVRSELSTFTNPILPGWHSDPSCAFVAEWNSTYFCTTSSFVTFPGIPVHASKDLIHWKMASNALTRLDQIPIMLNAPSGENAGIAASTLRFHDGMLHLITIFVIRDHIPKEFILFKTANPYDDAAWVGPIAVPFEGFTIDPDIFWDDDGSVYVASAGIMLQRHNPTTGESGSPVNVWNGTGGTNAEGPHLYKKDGWYYLLIAEGGTELNHAVTIARSKLVFGPYESYAGNPILTNRNTSEYFQTVGHADLFQDKDGNWWGVALSTRSGPEWRVYPMGRESVLFPVKWEKDEWPTLQPVRGRMSGPLPPEDMNVPGSGSWVDAGDIVDFTPGSELPSHFVHWRPPPNRAADYAVSPPHHPKSLALKASRANLTAYPGYIPTEGQTFISRRQSHTFFDFSIDISVQQTKAQQETGISVFLTSYQHIDLSIILLPTSHKELAPHIRLHTVVFGKPNTPTPDPVTIPLPKHWDTKSLRLHVAAKDEDSYEFSVCTPSKPSDQKVLGTVSAEIVSGGSGPFTGTLLGAYATTNGGNETFKAYVSRWRYIPIGQEIRDGEE